MRALAASLAAFAVIVGLRIGASSVEEGTPLITLPQGVTARTFGEQRVFVRREGTLTLTGFLTRAPQSGRPVRWCPISQVFLEPEGATMWDPEGRYVVGDERIDLTPVPIAVDRETQLVTAGDPQPATEASEGTIRGEVKLIYDNWLAGRIPLGVEFCRNAVT